MPGIFKETGNLSVCYTSFTNMANVDDLARALTGLLREAHARKSPIKRGRGAN